MALTRQNLNWDCYVHTSERSRRHRFVLSQAVEGMDFPCFHLLYFFKIFLFNTQPFSLRGSSKETITGTNSLQHSKWLEKLPRKVQPCASREHRMKLGGW